MNDFAGIYAEWSLIIFTTFCQLSIGLAVFATLSNCFKEEVIEKKLWCYSLVAVVIAGIASILHLQNPFNALYTLTQIGHSWLSREIVCVGLFGALVLWQAFKGSKIVGYGASLAGLLLLYVMTQVYASVEEMPYWRFLGTALAFFGTAFLFGGAVAFMLSREATCDCLKKSSLFAYVLGLVFVLASKIAWITTMRQNPDLAIPDHFIHGYFNLDIQLFGLLFASLLLFLKKPLKSPSFIPITFLLLLFAELAGRTVFFLAQFKIGV